ncbi:hypothetical protein N7474_009175 [Penicillium riverlandense]|uniref:uncharacterized protein n=1 Tax=Penicillium riverlandense TaxID=1903569 RepID=UPI002547C818|nr:uncharacterized protein N7474_009175 [Penicillium riverlandense]KAJ5807906.1 hypothetical protein N7474_009175 [Penicillium riverlandense]
MKFNVLALSALLALAVAQDTTTAHHAATTADAQDRCVGDANDVCCRARCYKVPCPSDSQANDTNSCVAACPQGNGSAADTQRYSDCEQNCYSSHFFPATNVRNGQTETVSAGNTAVTETGASVSVVTNSAGSPVSTFTTATNTAKGVTQTTNAASHVNLGASAAGLLGLVVAAFAM